MTEIGTDNVEEKLSRVGMRRDWISDAFEVVRDVRDLAEVAGSSTRKQQQFVEELKRGCRRLMYTCYYNNLRKSH